MWIRELTMNRTKPSLCTTAEEKQRKRDICYSLPYLYFLLIEGASSKFVYFGICNMYFNAERIEFNEIQIFITCSNSKENLSKLRQKNTHSTSRWTTHTWGAGGPGFQNKKRPGSSSWVTSLGAWMQSVPCKTWSRWTPPATSVLSATRCRTARCGTQDSGLSRH